MTKPSPRALIFGEALVDVFGDEEVVGGAPLNVAVHLARAGWRVDLLTRIGRDARGEAVAALLEREGVALDYLQREDGPTGWVSVQTSSEGEPSYTIHEGVAWDRIETPEALPEGVEVFYYNTLAARSPVSAATLERLLTRRAPWTIYDVNLRQDYWSEELVAEGMAHARLVKVNEDEVEVLAGVLGTSSRGPGEVFDRFERLEVLCVTRGGEGAELWLRNGSFFQCPTPSVEVVDTVGAGDAFCGNLVRGLVEGRRPEEALSEAVSRAATVVQHRGALPPRE